MNRQSYSALPGIRKEVKPAKLRPKYEFLLIIFIALMIPAGAASLASGLILTMDYFVPDPFMPWKHVPEVAVNPSPEFPKTYTELEMIHASANNVTNIGFLYKGGPKNYAAVMNGDVIINGRLIINPPQDANEGIRVVWRPRSR